MADKKLNDEVDNLKEDINRLSKDVSALLNALKQSGLDRADEARETFDKELERRREEIRRNMTEAKARGESAAASLEEEVTLHPMRSVLLAFGVGYVAAKLFNNGK